MAIISVIVTMYNAHCVPDNRVMTQLAYALDIIRDMDIMTQCTLWCTAQEIDKIVTFWGGELRNML